MQSTKKSSNVTKARAAIMGATGVQKKPQLPTTSLPVLFAVKKTAKTLPLPELTDTEDKIKLLLTDNGSARDLNIKVRRFPTNICQHAWHAQEA